MSVRPIRSALGTMRIVVLACTFSSLAMAGTVQGVAAYRERIALPPDAVFEAYRIDGNHLELMDAAGAVLARFEAVDLR